MAFQPETNTYEAGVYQLETTDPVQGGVGGRSNLPLLHLSNRTAWLKQQVDDLLLNVAAAATANSPTFTGDPKAPTATAGDNDTSIATTGFVQYALAGVLSLSVAGTGSTTLTAAQAGAGVLVLTGALTGARTVVVPNTGRWIVRNATTGAFSLTVKTAAGTGVIIPQGTATEVFADGTNAYFSDNVFSVAGRVGAVTLAVADVSGAAPLASPAFTGTPTAPTPAQFDNDTSIATTEFVQRALGNFQNVSGTSVGTSLSAADGGKTYFVYGASPFTLKLPPQDSVIATGWAITIICTAQSSITIAAQGTGVIDGTNTTGPVASITIGFGESVTLVYQGSGKYFALGANSANMKQSLMFGSYLATTGYQKLPSGLILQWGSYSVSANSSATVTLPITFPNSFLNASATFNQQDTVAASGCISAFIVSASQIRVSNSIAAAKSAFWFAIGY